MTINSFPFLLLFPFLFLAYYALPNRLKNPYLLVVSYAIYASFKPIFLLIIAAVTIVSYWFARLIENDDISCRKAKFVVGGILTFLPLFCFKYWDFINEQIILFIRLFVPEFTSVTEDFSIMKTLGMPIGISFFTFQAYGYLADVYFHRFTVEKNFWDYSLFVSFFPQIVSGPINRADSLLPQLKQVHLFDRTKAVSGLKTILWGIFMKAVVADRLAIYVNVVYKAYEVHTGPTCLLTSILYSTQLYADFQGYSLMAIGVARMLGYDFTKNFDRPYFAYSFSNFWRRWHISLSNWLKYSVYIPLGGSRCSKARNYLNLLLTLIVSGIWHGANWTFVAWGTMHGMLLVIEKHLGLATKQIPKIGERIARIFVVFFFVNLSRIFSRMPSISESFGVMKKIFTDFTPEVYIPDETSIVVFAGIGILILFLKDLRDEFFPDKCLLFENKHRVVRWASYIAVIFTILLLGVLDGSQFIYAKF